MSGRSVVLLAIQRALQEEPNSLPKETHTGYDRKPQPDLTGTDDILRRFSERLTMVGGETHVLSGDEAVNCILRELIVEFKDQIVLLPADPELERLGIPRLMNEVAVNRIQPESSSLSLAAEAAMGITTAQAGIADTGTIVLIHSSERGRLSALLAPVHVALLKKEMIFPDKITFLAKAQQAGLDYSATSQTWVTGPSLTADIEKVLVRGAHGPRRVIVLIYSTDQG
jgi:L-lactate dehydrogenase complex protein LldG